MSRYRSCCAMRSFLAGIALALSVALSTGASRAFAQGAAGSATDREISHLTGNLYTVRDRAQHTVFLVTAEGIILVDPLSPETSNWLFNELSARFPGRPVRYVVLTHHHFDRAEGAILFSDTAELVGHESFNRELRAARRDMSPFLARFDRNQNGEFDGEELEDGPNGRPFRQMLRRVGGTVPLTEVYRWVQDVETDYRFRRTITLGGSSVELIHRGSAHAADMTVLYFPSERVVFAVDARVTATPFELGDLNARDVVTWVDSITSLDFDTVLTGDGTTATKASVVELGEYLDALVGDVAKGYAAGRSLDQVKAGPIAERYAASRHYEARTQQIESVYRTLKLSGVELSGVAGITYNPTVDTYCASSTTCTNGGAVSAGSGALRLAVGRRISVVGEIMFGAQSWSSRTAPYFVEEFGSRMTRASVLFGYGSIRPRLSYRVLGGVSRTVVDARGFDRLEGGLLPVFGRHDIDSRNFRFGLTGGVDLATPIAGAFGIIVPIRITRTLGALPAQWPGSFDVQAGVGLTMRLHWRAQ